MSTLNEAPNLEAVQAALKAVKLLRSTVGDVFKSLADCPTTTCNNQTGNNDNGEQQKENLVFINEMQQSLVNVNARFRELETACTLLAPPSVPVNITLGNSSLLGQDPSYERTPLYMDMFNSYRWCDKMHEYSSIASTLLTQNSLKRTSFNSVFMKTRPRRFLSVGHNVQPAQVTAFLENIQRVFLELSIEIVRPFGNPSIVKITLSRTLRAAILMRGLLIEWVMIKGFNESFEDDNHSHNHKRMRRTLDHMDDKIDIWSESKYQVFRKVTEHANAAMLHFYSAIHPELGVRSFVTWLNSYTNLFSSACRKCNKRLENNMPPTWRDVRSLEVYHEQCKP